MISSIIVDAWELGSPVVKLESPFTMKSLYDAIERVIDEGYDHVRLGIFYEDQCNFTLEPDVVGLLASRGAYVVVSCYELLHRPRDNN